MSQKPEKYSGTAYSATAETLDYNRSGGNPTVTPWSFDKIGTPDRQKVNAVIDWTQEICEVLLRGYPYNFAYDMTVLPDSSSAPFKAYKYTNGTQSASVSGGILTTSATGSTATVDYRVNNGITVASDDQVIVSTEAKTGLVCTHPIVICDGTRAIIFQLSTNGLYYWSGVQYVIVKALTGTDYQKITVLKDRQMFVYVFIDDSLVSRIYYASFSSSSWTSSIRFGQIMGSVSEYTGYYKYFKASIITEAQQNLYAQNLYSSSGDSGMRISPTQLISTGTNQNNIIEANGSGEVIFKNSSQTRYAMKHFSSLNNVNSSSSTTITSSSTYYKLLWNNVGVEYGAIASTANNRITVPRAGYYMVSYDISLESGSAGRWSFCRVFVNGNNTALHASSMYHGSANVAYKTTARAPIQLNANDYIEVFCTSDVNGTVMTPKYGQFTLNEI